MGILSGNPKEEPMHYGEVFGVWGFLHTTNSCIAAYQTLLNHTGDDDLRKLIRDAIDLSKNEKADVEELLKENGIALPPAPPERPEANLEDIPPGARFMDNEIAAKISADTAAGLIVCSSIMGESIREDIGVLFGTIHAKKAALGLRFLRLSKEKGWLVPPPLHLHKKEE